jgi:hypothetical protein
MSDDDHIARPGGLHGAGAEVLRDHRLVRSSELDRDAPADDARLASDTSQT